MQEGKILRYNNVDLICVIDISGSMKGEKIRLVKRALEYVIDQLGAGDKMSIITFNVKATVEVEFTDNIGILK
jgi:Mg-chelatase subunit ChlD